MAIYHFDAKIVSRARGQSVVASAAYRSGEALHDDRYHLTHDYTRKRGIAHSEILAPEGVPDWVQNREALWNHVEAFERRKDAQLAREIEVGLPLELSLAENIDLVRDYVQRQFVSQGMIADFSIHRDDPNNPHAHILLTQRAVSAMGFGPKVRTWNAKAQLLRWRAAWAERANEHLARAGHAVRIDHRTLEAQGIELIPGRKIGIGKDRQGETALPRYLAERVAESERIAHDNGAAIIADPTTALTALTHQRATFTHQDIAKFLHGRTHGAEQFERAYLKVTTSAELVALGKDDRNRTRFTTRTMLEAERSVLEHSRVMADRPGHGVAASRQAAVVVPSQLSAEQRAAFVHVTGAGDLQAIVGVAGSGKSTLLAAANRAWEAKGWTVKGATLSGIAAENLQAASGIPSRTLASFEYAWREGRDPLTRRDVLVIDEAGMIGTRQLARFLAAADQAQAKVVLVGDPEQLQSIEAGASFRAVVGQTGMVELTQVRRQRQEWAREATQALSAGRTEDALAAYAAQGAVIESATQAEARARLLEVWAADAVAAPLDSRLMLAYTREAVRELNAAAREIRKGRHELGPAERIETTRGEREFAAADRILFLRNEKSYGVKNGSLGTVEAVERGVLHVRLDGPDARRVVVDPRDYADVDHGYATTVHKSQGSTVDRSYVLASRYFDRHTTYVALSRHREAALLNYGRDEFADGPPGSAVTSADAARRRFIRTLSRARPQELAHDYLEPDTVDSTVLEPPAPKLTPDQIQAAGRERWLANRARAATEASQGKASARDAERERGRERDSGRELPDDDFSL